MSVNQEDQEVAIAQRFLDSLENETDDGHQRRTVDTYMKIIQDFLSCDKNLIKPPPEKKRRKVAEEVPSEVPSEEPARNNNVTVFIPHRRQGDSAESCSYLRSESFQASIPLPSFKMYFFRPALYCNVNIGDQQSRGFLTDENVIQALTLLTDCYMKRCGVRSKNLSLAPNASKTSVPMMRKIGVYSYVFKLLGIIFIHYIFGDGSMVPWNLSKYIPYSASYLYDEEQDALTCWNNLDYRAFPHIPNAVNHYYLTRIYDFMIGTAKSILTGFNGSNETYYAYKKEDTDITYTISEKCSFVFNLIGLRQNEQFTHCCFKSCKVSRQQDDLLYASFRMDVGEQQWAVLYYFCCSHKCHEESRALNFVRACLYFLNHPLKRNFISDKNTIHVHRSSIILKRVQFLIEYNDAQWKHLTLLSLFGRFYSCLVLHSDDCFEFSPSKLIFKKAGEVIDPRSAGIQLYEDVEYIMDVECFPKAFSVDDAVKTMTVDAFSSQFFPDADAEELFWAAIAFVRQPFIPCKVSRKKERLIFHENDLDFLSLVSHALFPLFS